MAKFEVKNSEGKKVAEAELAAEVYGIEPNIHVMHHIVKCQMASWRQGTQSAKGRSEVSGGGKKPWRQKGTGRARQGSIRAAQWRHGGVVFAPKPRSYAKRMNNKEVKLAMRSALSAKLADGELVVVKDFEFEKPSTKAAVAAMKALGLEGRVALVMGSEGDGISRLVLEKCDFLTKLPQRGMTESLNVAQATTALCFEWLRRNAGELMGEE